MPVDAVLGLTPRVANTLLMQWGEERKAGFEILAKMLGAKQNDSFDDEDDSSGHADIDAMSAKHIAELKQRQKRGP